MPNVILQLSDEEKTQSLRVFAQGTKPDADNLFKTRRSNVLSTAVYFEAISLLTPKERRNYRNGLAIQACIKFCVVFGAGMTAPAFGIKTTVAESDGLSVLGIQLIVCGGLLAVVALVVASRLFVSDIAIRRHYSDELRDPYLAQLREMLKVYETIQKEHLTPQYTKFLFAVTLLTAALDRVRLEFNRHTTCYLGYDYSFELDAVMQLSDPARVTDQDNLLKKYISNNILPQFSEVYKALDATAKLMTESECLEVLKNQRLKGIATTYHIQKHRVHANMLESKGSLECNYKEPAGYLPLHRVHNAAEPSGSFLTPKLHTLEQARRNLEMHVQHC